MDLDSILIKTISLMGEVTGIMCLISGMEKPDGYFIVDGIFLYGLGKFAPYIAKDKYKEEL